MKTRTITSQIRGTVVGPIWWPVGEDMQKHVRVDLTRERDRFTERAGSLRHMVINIVADGDFQSASLTGDSELIVTCTSRGPNGTVSQKSRFIPLAKIKSIADCVAEHHVTLQGD
jgi:hypothetical protein